MCGDAVLSVARMVDTASPQRRRQMLIVARAARRRRQSKVGRRALRIRILGKRVERAQKCAALFGSEVITTENTAEFRRQPLLERDVVGGKLARH